MMTVDAERGEKLIKETREKHAFASKQSCCCFKGESSEEEPLYTFCSQKGEVRQVYYFMVGELPRVWFVYGTFDPYSYLYALDSL